MSADSILISWKPPTQPNGVVEQYAIYVREQGAETAPRSQKVRFYADVEKGQILFELTQY